MVLEVEDTGMGMNAEELQVIFDEFRQTDSPASRRAQGIGLGLAITRHLVHLHGGEIGVRSEKGQGTTFTITLPLGPTSKSKMGTERVQGEPLGR